MALRVEELLLDSGISPFGQWFADLDGIAAAKVRIALARIEQGNLSRVSWFRGIGEFRIDWGPGLRIYLAKDGVQVTLLLGGGDQAPPAARHRIGDRALGRLQTPKGIAKVSPWP